MKKFVSLSLLISLILSTSVPTYAWTLTPVDWDKIEINGIEQSIEKPVKTYSIKGFRDVPENHWAYDPIMTMTESGLFSGTTIPDAEGYGIFSPNMSMTKAQFITVVTRYLFPEELKTIEVAKGSPWYSANESIALKYNILDKNWATPKIMNQPINRQEMSLISYNVLNYLGKSIEITKAKSDIPDFHTVGTYYSKGVLTCYSAGILSGVDDKGTFNPLGTLTRAQGATVLSRLITVAEGSNQDSSNNISKREITLNKENIVVDNSKFELLENKEILRKVDLGAVNMSFEGKETKSVDVDLIHYGDDFYIGSDNVHFADILNIDNKIYDCSTNEKFIVIDVMGYNKRFENFNLNDFYITLSDSSMDNDYNKEYKEIGLNLFNSSEIEIGDYLSGYLVFKVSSEFLNTADIMNVNFYYHPNCDMIPSLEIKIK